MVQTIHADIMTNGAGEVLVACINPLPHSKVGFIHHQGGGIEILVDGKVAGIIEADEKLPDVIMLFAPNSEKGNNLGDALKLSVAA